MRKSVFYILRKVLVRKRGIVRRAGIKGKRKEYLEYKEKARRLVKERLEYWNQLYGFKIGKVAIRNTRSRWGSCSKKGNLNFNYKIALLPPSLSDYVIVHELCHLGEFNHSQRFWALVAETVPDYKNMRNKLKEINLKLPV